MKKVILFLCLAMLSISARAGKVVTDSLQSNVLAPRSKYNVYLPTGSGKRRRHIPSCTCCTD
jgi:hypothetical protein